MRLSRVVIRLCLLSVLLAACSSSPNEETNPAATPIPIESPIPTLTPVPNPSAAEPTNTETFTEAAQFTPTNPPPSSQANITQFPDPETYQWRLVIEGLSSPVGLENASDGSGRLFVVEQAGYVRSIRDGELLPEAFLDISEQVSCCGERGLLGLAFHPEFAQNGLFFVDYTDLNGDTVISRFQVSENPDTAVRASEVKLLGVPQPFRNHNGGGLKFGPDGYLYVALGDGGSGGDPQGNAQNVRNLLGTLLRLDVDQGETYAIPPDNPFSQGGGAPEIWVYGLRNPWRFSFDRLTGDLYIGDVGQNSWEEVNFQPAGSPGGANFGWNYREGTHPYLAGEVPDDELLVDPVAEYGRDQGITVIGGVVYRGDQFPEWQGIYLYGDYGSGNIWGLLRSEDDTWHNRLMFRTGSRITSFGEDESGEVYFVDPTGSLYRLDRN